MRGEGVKTQSKYQRMGDNGAERRKWTCVLSKKMCYDVTCVATFLTGYLFVEIVKICILFCNFCSADLKKEENKRSCFSATSRLPRFLISS